MARKQRKKSSVLSAKKKISAEDLRRARATAAGLEASFTEPPPPGALAPAPLFDEIRELGEAGREGMLQHLAATSPQGRVAALASLRGLKDPAVVPGLLAHAKALRWSPGELAALGETIRALAPEAALPPEMDPAVLGRAQEMAVRLRREEILSEAAAAELAEGMQEIGVPLREVVLKEAFGSFEKLPAGDPRSKNLLALARALVRRGGPPPAPLVDALAALATPEAVALLSEMAAGTEEKEAASRLRKVLYRLRNQGIVIEEKPARKAGREPAGTAPLDYVRAYVSAVDGRGTQMVWLLRSRQPRGRYVFQARLLRGRGIEEFVSTDMSGKEVRDFVGRLTGQPAYPIAEVPAGYACWLLRRAHREHETSGVPVPAGFTRSRMLLAPMEDPENFPDAAHPARAAVPAPREGEGPLAPERLMDEAAFWSWVFEGEKITAHFRRFVESMESRVALDDAQQKARLDQIAGEAAKDIFAAEEERRRLAGQLEDNAYFLLRSGREDAARACLTAADGMEAAGVEPPAFLVEMVRYSFSLYLNQLLQRAQAESPPAPEAGAGGTEGGEAPRSGQGGPSEEEGSPAIITP